MGLGGVANGAATVGSASLTCGHCVLLIPTSSELCLGTLAQSCGLGQLGQKGRPPLFFQATLIFSFLTPS